ncbi:MAG: peptide ABC transporter permease [Elusimicrobia bacterium RIFOXYC2_FULL_34_12]|nr:MAG: peptide ABC transporter permease [Elusimicrobia bacterium RIFOXYC2_FULL_34_12]OGS38127.1 MAG: peptide ABC transporter permease [Elusimicrobia bacterium RIFOXYD2_FULL_34_30]HAM39513.1 peptide ABC transporter permease [Elusimicrobiota bacterium]
MFKLYIEKLLRNKLAVAGIVIIIILIIIAALSPIIATHNPFEGNILERLQPPTSNHLLGTDEIGRDVFSRMIYGARISISVGIIAVTISLIIGTFLGLISGYFGGKIDIIIMRFVDIMLCFPSFFLILMVIAFLEPNIYNVMIVIGLTSWTGLARLVRGETLTIKERDFITAAKGLGLRKRRIIFVHILPNVISPVIVSSILGVGAAILVESGLSFLGLGVQPPTPSWGNILTSGKDYIHIAWWLSLFPGLAILITVLGWNLLGEGLRDVFDPRTN